MGVTRPIAGLALQAERHGVRPKFEHAALRRCPGTPFFCSSTLSHQGRQGWAGIFDRNSDGIRNTASPPSGLGGSACTGSPADVTAGRWVAERNVDQAAIRQSVAGRLGRRASIRAMAQPIGVMPMSKAVLTTRYCSSVRSASASIR